jgi:hypothetical protein
LVSADASLADPQNVLPGKIVDEWSNGSTVTMHIRLLGPRLQPEQPFDLQLDLPIASYERDGNGHGRAWKVVIAPSAMHVIAE